MSYCPNFCVVKSINNYTSACRDITVVVLAVVTSRFGAEILQSEESNPFACSWDTSVEPCALFFLVHFVGDVHQPLHVRVCHHSAGMLLTLFPQVSWADDEGGNKVKYALFSEKRL